MEDFKKTICDPSAKKAQEEWAKGKIKGEILNKISKSDIEKANVTLEETVEEVAHKYGISDISEWLEMMESALKSGNYVYKLDEKGFLRTNYSYVTMQAMKRDNELLQEAIEKREGAIQKAEEIIKKLKEKGKAINKEAVLQQLQENARDEEHFRTWINLLYDKEIITQQEEEERL